MTIMLIHMNLLLPFRARTRTTRFHGLNERTDQQQQDEGNCRWDPSTHVLCVISVWCQRDAPCCGSSLQSRTIYRYRKERRRERMNGGFRAGKGGHRCQWREAHSRKKCGKPMTHSPFRITTWGPSVLDTMTSLKISSSSINTTVPRFGTTWWCDIIYSMYLNSHPWTIGRGEESIVCMRINKYKRIKRLSRRSALSWVL